MFGLGGLDPKKMKAMMSQMGVRSEEIDAQEVVIKGREGNIVIKEPSVMKITMQGQESFQISGKIETETGNEEDIKIVMARANVSKEKAKEALKKSEGNIAEAIISLKR